MTETPSAEPPAASPGEAAAGGAPKRSMVARTVALKERAERRSKALEQTRLANFPVAVYRRYKKIEGSHLALIIGANAFIAVIPLLIIGYAFLEAFNPDRSIGTVLVERFHLTGDTAQTVRNTFTTAKAGKTVALSIGAISLLITGIDIASTVGTAYARAFDMAPLEGWRKLLRGWVWLLTLLAMTSVTLTLRYWAASRPWWFWILLAPLGFGMSLCFYWVTPRLVLKLPFGWRELLPGAVLCAVAAAVLNTASTFVLANWFSWYGHAYGAFGIALALMSWIGILSVFWMFIASAQGVYWERKASTSEILAMEEVAVERNEDDDEGADVVGQLP